MNLLSLLNSNEREIKKFRKIVEQINAFEPQMKQLTDEQLRGKTDEFRERLANGETLDDLLPEAFAVVREAGCRTLGENKARHFDVQMIGAMVLHQGRIAEMRTGEGKTLTATLPLYLNALEGKGAHLVTVNDYLSRRDARWYGPIYHFLGLSVGAIRGSDAETGEMGGSYMYDPDYVPEDEYSGEWPGLRPLHKEYDERTGRRMAYACDITYGTNHEFGFDYLRDNLAFSSEELVQRELNYAIVDEVDSILIDEARTPLIISGMAEESTDMYYKMDRVVARLYKDRDYTLDEKAKTAMLTEEGTAHVEELVGIPNLSDPENLTIMQHVNAALKARVVYKKDVDYVVKDGQIIIVDEFTGRMMFGRRYSDGLHQALEAKEGCEIQHESQTIATITYQNYFRLYNKLAGMTGTAKTEEEEFRKIYALDVVEIPTNKPMIRKDFPDVIYKSEDAKFRGLAMEILKTHVKGQPILVGTRSIEVSERVSERMISERLQTLAATIILRNRLEASKEIDGEKKKQYHALLNSNFDELTVPRLAGLARTLGVSTDMTTRENVEELAKALEIEPEFIDNLQEALKEGIVHNVLNAKYHEREAEIISQAGAPGAVTIATNMAGRGVDILLGGVPEEGKDINTEAAEMVRSLGGLHIVGSERHESRRIDNQLRGRGGRQGDPGSSKFFVSLEDELWRLFGDKSKSFLLNSWQEDQAIDARILSKMIERAQKKVEAYYFGIRKHVLEYDDVMNVQRELIYDQRRQILQGVDLRPTVMSYVEQTVKGAVAMFAPEGVHPSEWDIQGLFNHLNEIFPLEVYARPNDLAEKRREELEDFLASVAERTYVDKEQEIGEENMRHIERHIALDLINRKWMEHLDAMDYLREGIGLRGYAQQDPIIAYKKEAYDIFQQMMESLQDDLVRWLYRVQVQQPQRRVRKAFYNVVESSGELGDGSEVAPGQQQKAKSTATANARIKHKIGRNDPCPCGSGKKYKKCCLGKEE